MILTHNNGNMKNNCHVCNKEIDVLNSVTCKNCNSTYCYDCMEKNKRICKNCYHDLEF